MTVVDPNFDIIEAINLELQGPRTGVDAPGGGPKYREKKNFEQVALFHKNLTALKPAAIPKPKRKSGLLQQFRTIRSHSSMAGTTFNWTYDVTYEDGKQVESKSIGKVKL